MTADSNALRFLLLTFTGWVNRHQQDVIEYLVEENRILKEHLGGKCPRLSDDLSANPGSSQEPRRTLEDAGVRVVETPFMAPNCNAHAERFVRSIKEECLDRMILLGEGHLRRVLEQYLEHFHRERNHQGLDDELIEGEPCAGGEIDCRERLGGLLNYYYRAA